VKSPFVYTMRVRFRDTDMQGHVYFGNYFVFCDEALGAYMRAIGVPWQDMVDSKTREKVRVPRPLREAVAAFEEGRGDV